MRSLNARWRVLSFYGATGTVTGSQLPARTPRLQACWWTAGCSRAWKELRLRNWSPPPFDPASSSICVVLTHAHLDHTGYFPKTGDERLRRDRSLATSATTDLCKILWPDSGAYLQEEDARSSRTGKRLLQAPAGPAALHGGRRDARDCLGHRLDVPRRSIASADACTTTSSIRFLPGRAHPRRRVRRGRGLRHAHPAPGRRIVLFSGDLGRPGQPILPDPTPLPECDVLLLESTYGDRDHPARGSEGPLGEDHPRDRRRMGGTDPRSRRSRSVARPLLLYHTCGNSSSEGSACRPTYRSTSTARWRSRRFKTLMLPRGGARP